MKKNSNHHKLNFRTEAEGTSNSIATTDTVSNEFYFEQPKLN